MTTKFKFLPVFYEALIKKGGNVGRHHFYLIAFINTKVGALIATFLKSDCVSFGNSLYIVCRLAEPRMFVYNHSLARWQP